MYTQVGGSLPVGRVGDANEIARDPTPATQVANCTRNSPCVLQTFSARCDATFDPAPDPRTALNPRNQPRNLIK
ncbi:MAG: hypothetical protein FalmKO_10070 [Falsiruegeria mediterranea]